MSRISVPQSAKMIASIPSNRLNQLIINLLGMDLPSTHQLERRSEQRIPYEKPIYLQPIKSDNPPVEQQWIIVTGKQLSDNGLGFYHQQPLPYRRMIASLEQPSGEWLGVVIDITWCRFTKQGWYESGGRFLEFAPPLAPEYRK